jgi:hypothetical protein
MPKNLSWMKKLRLLMLIFAAALVAQVSNAQVSHEVWWEDEFSEANPGYMWGIDEALVDGSFAYYVNVITDKKTQDLKKLHINCKATTLVGESGTRYKYKDLVAQGKSWWWPTLSGGEVHYVGHASATALGEGKAFYIRVLFIIAIDANGDAYFKKFVIE